MGLRVIDISITYTTYTNTSINTSSNTGINTPPPPPADDSADDSAAILRIFYLTHSLFILSSSVAQFFLSACGFLGLSCKS